MEAVPTTGDGLSTAGVPMPTDLELWIEGQQTLQEQMADAFASWILSQPVEHNSGEAAPPQFEATPPALLAEPHPPTMDDHALHVTIWVGAAYYEPEIVDIELPVPLTLEYMKQALRGSLEALPECFDDLLPTIPQIGEHYGSFIAQPSWLRHTDRVAMVVDARPISGTVYVVYLRAGQPCRHPAKPALH